MHRPIGSNLTITETMIPYITACLEGCDVIIYCPETIVVQAPISWNTIKGVTLRSQNNIIIASNININNKGAGNIKLMAGIENAHDSGTVILESGATIESYGGGKVLIYYNPVRGENTHKYHNPYPYHKYVSPITALEKYMLVNNVRDLQDINYFLSGNYALSKNVIGEQTVFRPILGKDGDKERPFSGNFDGNNFIISDLLIENLEYTGIFGFIAGSPRHKVMISNLRLEKISSKGTHHIGILSGDAECVIFKNISFLSSNTVSGFSSVGGLLGSGSAVELIDIKQENSVTIEAREYYGTLAGALRDSFVNVTSCCINEAVVDKCVGLILNSKCID